MPASKKRSIVGKINYAKRARPIKTIKIEDLNDLNRSMDKVLFTETTQIQPEQKLSNKEFCNIACQTDEAGLNAEIYQKNNISM